MRIGVVPNLDRSAGGAYQYAVTMLDALAKANPRLDVVVFRYVGESLPPALSAVLPSLEMRRGEGALGRLRAGILSISGLWRAVDPAWSRYFRGHAIDALVFTGENDFAHKTGVPYVLVVHDLQHRLHPDFPEVSASGRGTRRERRLERLLPSATVVLVDSEVGREDLLGCYAHLNIDPDAVIALPFRPAHYLDSVSAASDHTRDAVRSKYGLPTGYLFYPAQFWPHKNHVRLVQALGLLAAEGLHIPLVLVGSHSEDIREQTFADVLAAAHDCGVRDSVHYLGYVPDEDMAALYSDALALVMPTFFGPSNIPALEAFRFSCPVLTSNIRGIREHVGDAALLVDPTSIESIADGLRRIIQDPMTRRDLVAAGHRWLSAYTHEDYIARLRLILRTVEERLHRTVGA